MIRKTLVAIAVVVALLGAQSINAADKAEAQGVLICPHIPGKSIGTGTFSKDGRGSTGLTCPTPVQVWALGAAWASTSWSNWW